MEEIKKVGVFLVASSPSFLLPLSFFSSMMFSALLYFAEILGNGTYTRTHGRNNLRWAKEKRKKNIIKK